MEALWRRALYALTIEPCECRGICISFYCHCLRISKIQGFAMTDLMRVYVFGDQTYDIGDLLTNLLHTHDDPVLSNFFERSYQTLKREVLRLGREKRADCPRFSSLASLLPLWRVGTLNPALSQALSCICQIGAFLQ